MKYYLLTCTDGYQWFHLVENNRLVKEYNMTFKIWCTSISCDHDDYERFIETHSHRFEFKEMDAAAAFEILL